MGDHNFQKNLSTRPLVADKAPSCGAVEVKDQKTVQTTHTGCKTVIDFHYAEGWALHQNIPMGGNEIVLIFRKQ